MTDIIERLTPAAVCLGAHVDTERRCGPPKAARASCARGAGPDLYTPIAGRPSPEAPAGPRRLLFDDEIDLRDRVRHSEAPTAGRMTADTERDRLFSHRST